MPKAKFFFDLSLALLAFVSFSAFYKTGIVSLLQIMVLLSSLVVIARGWSRLQLSISENRRLTPLIITSLCCLTFITLRSYLSGSDFVEAISAGWEYRIFLLLPLIILATLLLGSDSRILMKGILYGALFNLVGSYALHFDLIRIDGAVNSFGNRIFHGLNISTLACLCIYMYRAARASESNEVGPQTAGYWWLGVLLASGHNILYVEDGRTGALQICFVAFTLGLYFLTSTKYAHLRLATVIVLLVGFLGVLVSGGLVSILKAAQALLGDNDALRLTSEGYRIRFYYAVIENYSQIGWLGVGAGNAEDWLLQRTQTGVISIPPSDNVHSEFFNQFLIGGWVGLSLFVAWIASIYKALIDRLGGLGSLAYLGVFTIGLLFNSYLKDFGEKNLIICFVAWALFTNWPERPSTTSYHGKRVGS